MHHFLYLSQLIRHWYRFLVNPYPRIGDIWKHDIEGDVEVLSLHQNTTASNVNDQDINMVKYIKAAAFYSNSPIYSLVYDFRLAAYKLYK